MNVKVKVMRLEKEVFLPECAVFREEGGRYLLESGGDTTEVFASVEGLLSDGNSLDGILIKLEKEKDRVLKAYFIGKETSVAAKTKPNLHIVKAPMPGLVRSINVKAGDNVEKSSQVVVLEAMKMENSIQAGIKGKVLKIQTEQGKNIEKNEVLVEIEVI